MAKKKQPLSQEETDQLLKDLREIERLSLKLGRDDINISGLQDLEKNAGNIRTILKELKDEMDDALKGVGGLSNYFKDIVSEISNQNTGVKDSLKFYRNLTSIANELQGYQKGYNNLTEKDISNLKIKFNLEQESLKETQKILEKEKTASEEKADSLEKELKLLNKQLAAKLKKDPSLDKEKTKESELIREKTVSLNKEKTTLKEIDSAIKTNTSLLEDKDKTLRNLNIALSETLRQIKKDFVTDLDEKFRNVVDEIQTTDEGIHQIAKSFNTLTSIAQKVQDHQSGITELSEKDAKELLKKFDIEKKRLIKRKELLKIEKDTLETNRKTKKDEADSLKSEIDRLSKSRKKKDKEEAEVLKQKYIEVNEQLKTIDDNISLNLTAQAKASTVIDGVNEAYNTTVERLKLIEQQQKNVNNALGLSGAAVKGLEGALNKLGLGSLVDKMGLDEAKEKMKELAEEITDGGNKTATMSDKFKILNKGLSVIGTNLQTNLKDPLALAVALIGQFITALKGADEATGDLAKKMNLSYNGASELRQEFGRIANLSMDSAVTTKGLQESYVNIAQSLGATIDLNEEELTLMTKLREQAGYTNEEIAGIYKISKATGIPLKDNLKQFMGSATAFSTQKGIAVNVKQLLKDTANVSNSIKLSLGGSGEALAKAMVSAKALGVSLDKVDQIASSLLNFESSISAELEAELLTGKELNLERARYAALNNELATVAEEINREVGGSANFIKMNRIQQEAFAKAVGMTRDELSSALVEQEALKRTGDKTVEAARERYDMLRKTMTAEQAQAALGDDGLARQFEQQSLQERFNQSIEKLKEVFVTLADPILQIISPLADLASTILPAVNLALSPIIEGFKVVSNTISYIIDSVLSLIGYFTGANKELTAMQAIVGTIASTYLLYQGYVKAGLAYQGISAAFSERKALAENASKISIVAQRIAEGAALPFKAISAALSGTKAIAEVTAAEALTAGLVTIAIVGGLAMVAAAMSKANSQAVQVKDGVIDSNKKAVTLSGEFGTVQLDKNDKIYDAKDGKIKVGTDLFGEKKMSKDKMIPSSDVVNKTTNITNNITTKDVSTSREASTVFKNISKEITQEKEIANSIYKNILTAASQEILKIDKQKESNVDKQKENVTKELTESFKDTKNISENISKDIKEVSSNEESIKVKNKILSESNILSNNKISSNDKITSKTAESSIKDDKFQTNKLDQEQIKLLSDQTSLFIRMTKILETQLKVSIIQGAGAGFGPLGSLIAGGVSLLAAKDVLSTTPSLSDTEQPSITPNAISNENVTLPNTNTNTNNTSVNQTNSSIITNPTSPTNNISPVLELIQVVISETKAQNQLLSQLLSKNSDVYMDSTKVGTTSNIGATNIGR